MISANVIDVDAILQWLKLPIPERTDSPLTAKQQELFERWNVADNLMREHLQESVVMQMLVDKFKYSHSTARRDIDAARRVWATIPASDKKYLGEIVVDYLLGLMVKAGTAKKYGDVAKLAKEIREYSGIGKNDPVPYDQAAMGSPNRIEPALDPSILGVQPMTNDQVSDLVQKLLAQKSRERATDADFEEHGDAAQG